MESSCPPLLDPVKVGSTTEERPGTLSVVGYLTGSLVVTPRGLPYRRIGIVKEFKEKEEGRYDREGVLSSTSGRKLILDRTSVRFTHSNTEWDLRSRRFIEDTDPRSDKRGFCSPSFPRVSSTPEGTRRNCPIRRPFPISSVPRSPGTILSSLAPSVPPSVGSRLLPGSPVGTGCEVIVRMSGTTLVSSLRL